MSLLLFMIGAVVAHWTELSATERFVFSGLTGLGLYMVWRAREALATWHGAAPGWKSPFIDHIGFTLISLFDGFVIVSAIDLHAPGWLVAIVAVLGVVVGTQALGRRKRRLDTSAQASAS